MVTGWAWVEGRQGSWVGPGSDWQPMWSSSGRISDRALDPPLASAASRPLIIEQEG